MLPIASLAESKVSVGFYLVNDDHRRAVEAEMNRFRDLYPEISLDLQMHRDHNYTAIVDKWLQEGDGPDVFYWHGGQQVKFFSDQGKLQDIRPFWEKNDLDTYFSKAGRSSVEFDNKIYGVPVTEQLWGLFYRVSTMEKHDIEVPKTWDAMLKACAKAKEHDATLFAFGGQTAWTAHGWFDYMNLRVNGLEYHQKLLDGEISFLDKGVLSALEHWKEMLDQGCLNDNFDHITKDSAFPLLFHERAFMILTFSRGRFPASLDRDFAFAPFPNIDKSIPQYTVAPVEVFIVPAYAKWSKELEIVLDFLSSKAFQEGFNSANRVTPAHNQATIASDALSTAQASFLRASPGGIQYFDRNTRFDFASYTPTIFVDFMRDRDIKRCSERLEALRKKVFLSKSDH